MEPIAKRTRLSLNKNRLYFVDLPFDVIYTILKLVDTSSKCKFSRCSKQCYEDVAKFKNYIKEVKVSKVYLKFVIPALKITVKFDDLQSDLTFTGSTVDVRLYRHTKGYSALYKTFFLKLKSIKNSKIKEKSDIDTIIARHFGYIMKHSSNSRFALKMFTGRFPYEAMNLTSLKKLKSLEMPKMPLEIDFIGRELLDMKQVYAIEEVVQLNGVISTVQQLQNLKAKQIVLESKEFSSKNVNEYIKLFMDGQIHENVEDVHWFTEEGELNFDEIVDGFEIIDKLLATKTYPLSSALVRTTNGYGVAIVWVNKNWVHIKFFSEMAFQNCKETIYQDGIDEYLSQEKHTFNLYAY